MPYLEIPISRGLWRALLEHTERTREPLAHAVSKALADYLQVSHHTLYQVSTSAALVEGIYQGAVRVGTLREHGDLGLGTFENLDGEMVVVDGQFFQVRGDGCSLTICRVEMFTGSPLNLATRAARRSECARVGHQSVSGTLISLAIRRDSPESSPGHTTRRRFRPEKVRKRCKVVSKRSRRGSKCHFLKNDVNNFESTQHEFMPAFVLPVSTKNANYSIIAHPTTEGRAERCK